MIYSGVKRDSLGPCPIGLGFYDDMHGSGESVCCPMEELVS